MRLKDLTGKRFGKLIVLKRAPNKKTWTMFSCQCDCGKKTTTYSTHLIRGNVLSCGCDRPKGSRMWNWTGYEEITGNFWSRFKASTKRSNRVYRRKIKVKLTPKDGWELFLKQGKKCALSGVLLSFGKTRKEITASLDRIDSKGNYELGNVQWVHKDINRMKNVYSQSYFIDICCKVANNTSGQCEL